MEDIKFGTISKDMREKIEETEIYEEPNMNNQKPKKITLADVDLSNRFTGISDGTKVANPCHFAVKERLSRMAGDTWSLLYYTVGEKPEDGPCEALKKDQHISEILRDKIMRTPLDELSQDVALGLIYEIRRPYETINDVFNELAEHDYFVKIDNKTKLNTSIDDLIKRPLYIKLQSAIDELNRRGVILKTDNQNWINMVKTRKKIELRAEIKYYREKGYDDFADASEQYLKAISDPNYVDIDYIARKDVLLEAANIGHLLPDDETEEMKADHKAMCQIWNDIMDTKPQDLNDVLYEAFFEKINAIKYKYVKPYIPDLRDYLDNDEASNDESYNSGFKIKM